MNDTTNEIQEKSAHDIAREFMLGELIGAATKQLRSIDKPWLRLPEAEQKRVLRDVQNDIKAAVTAAVELIASDDRTRFRAHVESVTFKEGVKAVLQMGNTAASHELADTAGASVLVVIEDPARYLIAGENTPKPTADQAEIPA